MSKRMQSLALILVLVLLGPLSAGAEESALSWLDGWWTGTGLTLGNPDPFTIEFTCDVANEVFLVRYPSLDCGGTWELLDGDETIAYFVEHVEEDSVCVDGGTVVVTRIDDRFITYSFFYPDERTLDSFSTLERSEF